jgi:hypothetical protein
MGTSAVFGTAVFGQAVFGDNGGAIAYCQIDPYLTGSDFITAAETVSDANFLQALPFREAGTRRQKLLLIQSG